MGTRSVVAVPLDGGFQGRYVHWDGYPSGVGVVLADLVQRDGVETVRRVLTDEHYGWSNLDPRQPYSGVPTQLGYDDGRFVAVEGYGIAYTTEQGQSSPDQWIRHTDTDTWCEWGYVLNDTVLSIFRPSPEGWTHVGDLPYDNARETFSALEQAVYAIESEDVDA
jgi:hypothetical protein